MGDPWWRRAAIYQIYPRSFADSNGDGIGDLRGIISHLDHLSWLGVQGIWLNPTMPSPNADWGYDVSDYAEVHPDLGSLADLDELIDRAGAAGIRVLLDLVPNHTSNRHPWFEDALTSRGSVHRTWYVWAEPGTDGGPPNNWINVFRGGPAWTFHPSTGQYYLHNFLPEQPDLDWWNPDVRSAFDDILRFWFERGVAGFRIDVAHAIIKDRELRDNPPTDDLDHAELRKIGQRQLYNMNRPEGHDVIRRWRSVCESYDPPRILAGETYVLDLDQLASFYGKGGDELNLAFNFPFVFSEFEPEAIEKVVRDTHGAIPDDAWPVWMASNHDVGRFPTRWCDGDDRKIRLALMMLLTLGGTTFLYYGDELGMTSVDVPRDRLKDPVGIRHWPEDIGRDHCRTPMPWTDTPGAGFTTAEAQPWLPLGAHRSRDVTAQRSDPSSNLHLTRSLIGLRERSDDLGSGSFESLGVSDGVWLYRRGAGTTVVLNMSERPAEIDAFGEILVATDRALEGDDSPLTLGPWEGAVLAHLSSPEAPTRP